MVIYDLSQIYGMEEKLRQLENAVEQSAACILIARIDEGKIEYANEAYCNRIGLPKNKIIGMSHETLAKAPFDPEKKEIITQTLLSGENWKDEFSYRNQASARVWESVVFSPIRDREGNVTKYLAMFSDISEEKVIEAELSRNRELLVEAERIANLGSWELDLKKNTLEFSTGMYRLLGIDFTDMPIHFKDILRHIHKEDRQILLRGRKQTLQEGGALHVVLRWCSDVESSHFIELSGEVQRSEDLTPLRLIGVARDVTEQRKLEDLQRIQTENLVESRKVALSLMQDATVQRNRAEAALEELKASQEQLLEARNSAEQANQAKSQFLAMMSHEIRTPINGVVGVIDLLRRTEPSEEQSRLIEIAQTSSVTLMGIITDVLDFSKIEAGKLQLDEASFTWFNIVTTVAELLSELVRRKQISLICHVDPDLKETLIGDPVRLQQILLNLLSNALKFTSTTEEKKGSIFVSATKIIPEGEEKEYVRLSIRDNGIGIGKSKIPRSCPEFRVSDHSGWFPSSIY